MSQPLLSILVCHLLERRYYLERLLKCLAPQTDIDLEVWRLDQIPASKGSSHKPLYCRNIESQVDITINSWTPREATTGQKRNRLIQEARGDFIAFIDDDDLVAPNYVDSILGVIRNHPSPSKLDCIGLVGQISWHGERRTSPRKFIHTLECKEWHEKDGVYYRTPNHLNPIAARHAKAVPFPDITVGEDHVWSNAIRPLLRHEILIEDTLYFYECR